MSLTTQSLKALQDPSSPPGTRSIACRALVHAIELGVPVPTGTAMACWQFLLQSGADSCGLRPDLQDRQVAQDAVRILRTRECSLDQHNLAYTILQGGNVTYVTEPDLAAIVEVLTDGRALRIGWLIGRVHEGAGLSLQFLVTLRDRLAGSTIPEVRSEAPGISSLLPRLDQEFAIRMFQDPVPRVRSALASMLEQVEDVDQETALKLVQAHTALEQHRDVLSTCHFALGSLMRSVDRGIRRKSGVRH